MNAAPFRLTEAQSEDLIAAIQDGAQDAFVERLVATAARDAAHDELARARAEADVLRATVARCRALATQLEASPDRVWEASVGEWLRDEIDPQPDLEPAAVRTHRA